MTIVKETVPTNQLNVEEIRNQFPILDVKVKGKRLIYFDNGATAQKPTGYNARENHKESRNESVSSKCSDYFTRIVPFASVLAGRRSQRPGDDGFQGRTL